MLSHRISKRTLYQKLSEESLSTHSRGGDTCSLWMVKVGIEGGPSEKYGVDNLEDLGANRCPVPVIGTLAHSRQEGPLNTKLCSTNGT